MFFVVVFSLISSRVLALAFHANCLLCMKCHRLFSGNNQKLSVQYGMESGKVKVYAFCIMLEDIFFHDWLILISFFSNISNKTQLLLQIS